MKEFKFFENLTHFSVPKSDAGNPSTIQGVVESFVATLFIFNFFIIEGNVIFLCGLPYVIFL